MTDGMAVTSCESEAMRISLAAAVMVVAALMSPQAASAQPDSCDAPACAPGIALGVILGAPYTNTTHYVFETTS